MAALRFEARADGGPTVHRLGHRDLESNLHTWETEVRTYLFRNGSGYVVVLRKGRAVHRYDFPAEDVEIPPHGSYPEARGEGT